MTIDLEEIRQRIQRGPCTEETLIILQLVSEIDRLRGEVEGMRRGSEQLIENYQRLMVLYLELQTRIDEDWEDANA